MRLQKGILLVFVLAFVAIILTACFPPKIETPSAPAITPNMAIVDTVHPVDGVFASCNDCHAGVQHTSKAVDNFACIDCHTMTPTAEAMGLPAGIPHSTEGPFANCASCHQGLDEVHAVFSDYSDCQSCHKPLAGGEAGGGFATLLLPANHKDNPAFADCATCHAGGKMLPKAPTHPLDGMYADCASCHTVEFKDAADSPKLAALKLPANHKDNPAFANCATCHADGKLLPSKPSHPLTGDYAKCATCHDVSYKAPDKTGGDKPAGGGLAALSLPANHKDNPAYANCATCHAGGAMLPAKPSHPLDGSYANCASCHTVTYKTADKPADKPTEDKPADKKEDKPAGGGLAALNLPANHKDNAAYANCATCHAGGAMLPSVPSHPLDGNYANCASCHTINYK